MSKIDAVEGKIEIVQGDEKDQKEEAKEEPKQRRKRRTAEQILANQKKELEEKLKRAEAKFLATSMKQIAKKEAKKLSREKKRDAGRDEIKAALEQRIRNAGRNELLPYVKIPLRGAKMNKLNTYFNVTKSRYYREYKDPVTKKRVATSWQRDMLRRARENYPTEGLNQYMKFYTGEKNYEKLIAKARERRNKNVGKTQRTTNRGRILEMAQEALGLDETAVKKAVCIRTAKKKNDKK
jgi:hypothetical protein